MKHFILGLLFLPLTVFAQQENTADPDFEGWQIKDCQAFALKELTKGENGKLSTVAKGRVSEKTKTIYLARQTWLQEIKDTVFNGIAIKQVDIDENIKTLADDVKNGTAAIFYISPFELKAPQCEMWIFPVDVNKKFMGKAEQQYATTVYRMNFFFNYDPPKYEYRGMDTVVLE